MLEYAKYFDICPAIGIGLDVSFERLPETSPTDEPSLQAGAGSLHTRVVLLVTRPNG